MGISEKTLNEIEQEMVSYLLNVDDMNYAMLYEPLVFGNKSNSMSEIQEQRASYLLNLDDLNYEMLAGSLTTGKKSPFTPRISNIEVLGKLNLVNDLVYREEGLGSYELINAQSQIEFPKGKFHPLRPATLEDEVADDTSYSE
jgi:hypothetical protein